MSTQHNIRTYLRYALFCDLMIIGPIIVLFMEQKGLSFSEIMTLQSIFALSIVFLEVPTGAIADKLGRKLSLVLGSLALALCLSLYMAGGHFIIFALAEIAAGLGVCLKSGADSALLYDTLKEEGRESEFQGIYGRGQSRIYLTQAVGSLVSSILFVVHPYLPYGLSVIFMLISGFFAFQFIEPFCEGKTEHRSESYSRHMISSGRFVLTHRKVFAVTLFSVLAFTCLRSGFWLYQPYFQGIGLDVRLYGGCFFVFNLMAAWGSKNSHLFISWTKSKTLVAICLLIAVSFVGMGWIQGLAGVLFIAFQQLARGLYKPVLNKYVNKQTASHQRATVLSFISLISNLAVAAALPLIGLLYEKADIYQVHMWLGGGLLLLTILLGYFIKGLLGPRKPAETP